MYFFSIVTNSVKSVIPNSSDSAVWSKNEKAINS